LARINRVAAVGGTTNIDAETAGLVAYAKACFASSEGAFDITYASVGHLYDFPHHVKPTEAQIKDALPGVNWRNMLVRIVID